MEELLGYILLSINQTPLLMLKGKLQSDLMAMQKYYSGKWRKKHLNAQAFISSGENSVKKKQ